MSEHWSRKKLWGDIPYGEEPGEGSQENRPREQKTESEETRIRLKMADAKKKQDLVAFNFWKSKLKALR